MVLMMILAMNRSKSILVFFLLLFSTVFCFDMQGQSENQESELTGSVMILTQMGSRDRDGFYEESPSIMNVPASKAVITLIARGDTLRTRTNEAGTFSFKNLPSGPVQIAIDFVPMASVCGDFELMPGENIVMVSFSELLKIQGNSDEHQVEQDGHKLICYNPLTIEEPHAVSRLRRFPGVKIQDQQIVVDARFVRCAQSNDFLMFSLLQNDSEE